MWFPVFHERFAICLLFNSCLHAQSFITYWRLMKTFLPCFWPQDFMTCFNPPLQTVAAHAGLLLSPEKYCRIVLLQLGWQLGDWPLIPSSAGRHTPGTLLPTLGWASRSLPVRQWKVMTKQHLEQMCSWRKGSSGSPFFPCCVGVVGAP